MAQQSCYLEGEILTRAQFQLSTECPPFSYSHHMPRITCQTRQCLSSCWHVASVDITPETCWEKKAWTSCAYWAGWVCDFALSQLCSCVTGGHSQKPVWAELPRERTAVVKKTVCPEEGYNCVCPLNYRVWQRVFCASMFKNVGHRLMLEKWDLCVFRRDNQGQMKCPACGFARRFPFAILSWQHQRIIPCHWLSDETHECVIAMLHFIIPVGPCSTSVWAVFKWGMKQESASQCFPPDLTVPPWTQQLCVKMQRKPVYAGRTGILIVLLFWVLH